MQDGGLIRLAVGLVEMTSKTACKVGDIMRKDILNYHQASEMATFLSQIPDGTIYFGAASCSMYNYRYLLDRELKPDGIEVMGMQVEDVITFVAKRGDPSYARSRIGLNEWSPSKLQHVIVPYPGNTSYYIHVYLYVCLVITKKQG